MIRRSAEHLTNLVEGLLEMSRIESGVITVRSDVVDVRALLEQVADMFRAQAAAKGLSLALTVTGRLPARARTDAKRLRQILINLVSNAVKYTHAGGVTLRVGYRSQVMDLTVEDSGIGIAPDDLDRVFAPFERGAAADVRGQPGIGLGLAITRMLVHVLGGDIALTSTPGVGSSFRLRLMLPEAAPPPDEAAAIDDCRGAGRTLLVIDDDPAQRAVLESFLAPLGFTVQAAGSGEEGLALAARCPPDVVLLDIQMPGMGGWETAGRLRAAHGDALRIVMVSANAQEFRAGGDGRERHDAFVTKPVDLGTLLDIVGQQLGRRDGRTPAVDAEPGVAPLAPPAIDEPDALERIRRLASIGHVRGLDQALRDLDATAPDAAGLVATLRAHLDAFDLRSLVQAVDDAEAF